MSSSLAWNSAYSILEFGHPRGWLWRVLRSSPNHCTALGLVRRLLRVCLHLRIPGLRHHGPRYSFGTPSFSGSSQSATWLESCCHLVALNPETTEKSPVQLVNPREIPQLFPTLGISVFAPCAWSCGGILPHQLPQVRLGQFLRGIRDDAVLASRVKLGTSGRFGRTVRESVVISTRPTSASPD